MNNFITVATSDYPTDLITAKHLLESAGIECFLKDELMNQTYSVVVGNVQLQVKAPDVDEAIKIIDSTGYKRDLDQGTKFWETIDNSTNGIPLLKNVRVELRFIILSFFAISAIVYLTILLFAFSTT